MLKYYAVKYWEGGKENGNWGNPILCDFDTYSANTSPSAVVRIELLKTYAADSYDAALRSFINDYPPQKDNQRYWHGWIAPNGDFYPVQFNHHDWLADDLALYLYGVGEMGRGVIKLEQMGWLRFHETGRVDINYFPKTITPLGTTNDLNNMKRIKATKDQINRLVDLAMLTEQYYWKRNIGKAIEQLMG